VRGSPINSRLRRGLSGLAIAGVIGASLAACGVSTPPGMCGWIVGNGVDGHDANIHSTIWPGMKSPDVGDGEEARFIPCGPRNVIINDGQNKDASGTKVGDRDSLTKAYTSTGVETAVASSSYWTPNQSELDAFYELCLKYECYTTDTKAGQANFSTKGWNGMLAENFLPAIDRSIQQAMLTMDDSVWRTHDANLKAELGKLASSYFAAEVRKTTGVNGDLFCGSGNSKFAKPDEHKGWNCTEVRIVIDDITATSKSAQNITQRQSELTQQKLIDAQRRAQAEALYGDQASFWLGLQDTCAKVPSCVISTGNGSPSAVTVPSAAPKK
jgi:hypothetical protein